MINNYSIREAGVEDVLLVSEIESDSDNDIYSPNLIRSAIEDRYTNNFLIFENNVALGYLSANMIFEDCNLIKIVVKKEYRRQGVARCLIDYLKKIIKNLDVKKIYLEVRCDNTPAVKLYEKCDFKLSGVRKGYYNGVDALIYIYNND